MSAFIDLTGQRFGHLIVLEHGGKGKGFHTWKCRCDCGNEIVVPTTLLKTGKRTSCGCKQFKKITPRKALDITGQKFGSLTALYPCKDKPGYWHCRCDCGNEKDVRKQGLISGNNKTCGADIHKIKNLTGQVFGKLTVLEYAETRNNRAHWRCRCECGNEIVVSAHSLHCGKQSCGCDRAMDLTGRRVGLLTVLYPTEEKRNGSVMWMCKCDCGNTKLVRAEHIQRNAVNSCGCRMQAIKDITGEKRGHLTALRLTGKKSTNGSSIYEWRCDCGNVFELPISSTSGKKTIQCPECRKKLLQKISKEMRDSRELDPESGLAVVAFNNIVDGKPTKSNTSGIRGVHWNEGKQKWEVSGRENRKFVYLGAYKDINEARKVRERFVQRVYGKKKGEE